MPRDAPAVTRAPAMAAPLDRLYALRDRLLASDRFRRLAVRFPLTRPVARRHARAAFDLTAGFVYTQVLLACVRLRLLDVLAERPLAVPVLARRAGVPLRAMERLLAAACAIGLATRRGGDRFGLGAVGAAIAAQPALAAMVEHNALLYADLADPVALLRGEATETALARYWAYARSPAPDALPPERVADYSALMAASQPLVAGDVLAAYPFARHAHVLDVGGGEGTFLAAVAERHPTLALTLFDLPAVAERARARLAERGLAHRVAVAGGSFLADRLPPGADLVTLVRVVHDHDDDAVLALLRNVRRSLAPGATLLIAEPLAGTPDAGPVADAYFGLYLMAMGQGHARSPQALRHLLERAGFARVRVLPAPLPWQAGLVVASAA